MSAKRHNRPIVTRAQAPRLALVTRSQAHRLRPRRRGRSPPGSPPRRRRRRRRRSRGGPKPAARGRRCRSPTSGAVPSFPLTPFSSVWRLPTGTGHGSAEWRCGDPRTAGRFAPPSASRAAMGSAGSAAMSPPRIRSPDARVTWGPAALPPQDKGKLSYARARSQS
jgi:hypothetical protein